jgi:two-component system NarL family response regulator
MRLAIVDDNFLIRENLRLVLSGEENISVVGAFGSAGEALGGLKESFPDVLLVELVLPDMPGIEFIRKARTVTPKLDIMVYTVFDDWKTVFSALKAGAMSFILKGTNPRRLVEAITELYEGGAPMSPKIARMVITGLHGENGGEYDVLSTREKEILRGMDKGLTYREIAKMLLISPHTVRTHIRNIYEKIQVKSKGEALRKARKGGAI